MKRAAPVWTGCSDLVIEAGGPSGISRGRAPTGPRRSRKERLQSSTVHCVSDYGDAFLALQEASGGSPQPVHLLRRGRDGEECRQFPSQPGSSIACCSSSRWKTRRATGLRRRRPQSPAFSCSRFGSCKSVAARCARRASSRGAHRSAQRSCDEIELLAQGQFRWRAVAPCGLATQAIARTHSVLGITAPFFAG